MILSHGIIIIISIKIVHKVHT